MFKINDDDIAASIVCDAHTIQDPITDATFLFPLHECQVFILARLVIAARKFLVDSEKETYPDGGLADGYRVQRPGR
jgi:hypothetical protein